MPVNSDAHLSAAHLILLQVSPPALRGNLTEGTFTFLPLGPVPDMTLDEYRASIAAPPAQPVLQTHRFLLSQVANKVCCKSLLSMCSFESSSLHVLGLWWDAHRCGLCSHAPAPDDVSCISGAFVCRRDRRAAGSRSQTRATLQSRQR